MFQDASRTDHSYGSDKFNNRLLEYLVPPLYLSVGSGMIRSSQTRVDAVEAADPIEGMG